jgi:hypothetical protein
MNTSIFPQYVEKYFPNYVLSVVERLNGRSLDNQIPFMFRELLTPTYSPDGRWASLTAAYKSVAADVVALGSPLPLKKRDSLATVVGSIPKIGVKYSLNEAEMKTIDAMMAQNRSEAEIVNRIFSAVPKAINGIDERIEDVFLSMLSTGVGLTVGNVGEGIRLDMKFLAENRFTASDYIWTNASATPVDDIQKVVDKASEDGHVIRHCYADDATLRVMGRNAQVRGLFGFSVNFVGGGANVPNLTFTQLAEVFMSEWNITLHRVSRTTFVEINGVSQGHKAWEAGTLAFTCDDTIGDLVYTATAEETRPVGGVAYQKASDYTLVSEYSETDPIIEYTASQAMVVPIINNVDRIYLLNSTEVEA